MLSLVARNSQIITWESGTTTLYKSEKEYKFPGTSLLCLSCNGTQNQTLLPARAVVLHLIQVEMHFGFLGFFASSHACSYTPEIDGANGGPRVSHSVTRRNRVIILAYYLETRMNMKKIGQMLMASQIQQCLWSSLQAQGHAKFNRIGKSSKRGIPMLHGVSLWLWIGIAAWYLVKHQLWRSFASWYNFLGVDWSSFCVLYPSCHCSVPCVRRQALIVYL